MDLSGLWTVLASVVGFAGGILPTYLGARGKREERRVYRQEKTITDLQDALSKLDTLSALSCAARNTDLRSEEIDPAKFTLADVTNRLSRISDRHKSFLTYRAGKRRAEILTARVEDSKARELATDLIGAAEIRSRLEDDTKNYESNASLGEKFTKANDRLGEVLRGLH